MTANVPRPAAIYHICHARNLRSVLEEGGLCCDAAVGARNLSAVSIAHAHIKQRRANKRVPVGPRGTLTDYVPFYFAPRSPMLHAIYKKNVEGYTQSQEPIVHLVSTVEAVAESGLVFVFTNGHAAIRLSQFYTDLAELSQVDWPIMRERYWYDTDEDGDRSRRRQAEFLVHQFFPWSLVSEVGVMTTRASDYVGRVLEGAAHRPPVRIRRPWYY